MKHGEPTDSLREQAALYALSNLPSAEAEDFEAHLARGCSTCADEVRALSAVAGLLASAAPLTAPPAELRDRVLARARAPEEPPWMIARAAEGPWEAEPGAPSMKYLYRDRYEARMTALARLEPGGVFRLTVTRARRNCTCSTEN
jgi:anti-sigma factor RsiW